MKIYFYKRHFYSPDYLYGANFPERFTFATNQEKLPPYGSFLIIEKLEDFGGTKFYITKIKRKDKITTFDHRISCVDVREITFSLPDIIKLLNLKESRFTKSEIILLIAEKNPKLNNLIEYIKRSNFNLEGYFNKKELKPLRLSIETSVQVIDAFATAFDIFGLNRHNYTRLSEEQIMDWEIEKLSPFMSADPDGKRYLEMGNKKLYIQKVHNTAIERCLGVDLIYNFIGEHRVIFIQYKCFNHDNKKYYKSKDTNSELEIKRMTDFDFIRNCQNISTQELTDLRICDCPMFVKLCSREISEKKEEPYGYYYAVCVWRFLTKQEKSFIDYDDEPKISNSLFKDLVRAGLIGTIKQEAKLIDDKLLKDFADNRLTLIFTEKKVVENC
ncbi:MAG: hypothetical protein WC437_04145 [Patescibacteria group bacterium]